MNHRHHNGAFSKTSALFSETSSSVVMKNDNSASELPVHSTSAATTAHSSSLRRRSRHCLVLSLSTLVASVSLIRLIQSCYSIQWSILDAPTESTTIPMMSSSRVKTVFLESNQPFLPVLDRLILLDGAPNVEFRDSTQYYPRMDSSDAEETLERRIFPQHELNDNCEPMNESWQSTFHPTCNEFHQQSFVDTVSEDELRMLSTKGFWRYAWEYEEPASTSKNTTSPPTVSSIVFKNLKLAHSYEEAYYENNRVDAIAMERLTASPYVVDIYGYCGMSVYTEYAGQTISTVVDKLPSVEKLKLAQQVAQGVADLHGIDGTDRVSLVHNDLNFANILISEQTGLPLVNDFNVAILQMQDKDTGKTCPFTSHFPNPQWRSPEEQVDEETGEISTTLTEKVDIYGLGNVLYRVAVGQSPWKKKGGGSLSKEEKLHIAHAKLKEGAVPHVPSAVRKDSDPAIQALLTIMRECYRHRPELRPTAKQVVEMLQDAIDQIVGDSDAKPSNATASEWTRQAETRPVTM